MASSRVGFVDSNLDRLEFKGKYLKKMQDIFGDSNLDRLEFKVPTICE